MSAGPQATLRGYPSGLPFGERREDAGQAVQASWVEASLLAGHLYQRGHGRPPTIVTGDFNCKPGSAPYEVFREHGFTDTLLAAGNTDDGDAYTFHAFKGSSFKPSDTDKPFGRIDWILLRDTAGRFGVVGHQIPRDADEEAGLYPSDPYPAFVDLSISE